MKEPIPGMDRRKSKVESLYLKEIGRREEEAEEPRPQRGALVRIDYPHFAQVPQALIRDPEIPHAAVRLYGIYHTYAQNTKDLRNRPSPFVSQKKIAKDMGIHRNRISYWTQYLHGKGWLTIKRRGWNRSNEIMLHGKRKMRRQQHNSQDNARKTVHPVHGKQCTK